METKKFRVNVDFPESVYSELEYLASRSGKTKAQVLRDAIALEAWFEKTRQEGGHVLVEREGNVREVMVR